MPIPPFVIDRLRVPAVNANIVPNSTPVISFGDFRTAKVATLGLNPSVYEFLERNGVELGGGSRRFETLTSLGVQELQRAPVLLVEQAFNRSVNYFMPGGNAYWRWFGQLTPILAGVGGDYRCGTACHLDIVQWATNPVWSALTDTEKDALVLAQPDRILLDNQLEHSDIEILLLNGVGVVDVFRVRHNVAMTTSHPVIVGRKSCKFYCGTYTAGTKVVRVFGWSLNIQSTPMRNEMKALIAAMVKCYFN
jgi:hypothetical protein